MALAMPSRFAVLKIEDDDFKPPNPNKAKDKKKDAKQASKKSEKVAPMPVKKPTKVSGLKMTFVHTKECKENYVTTRLPKNH